MQSMINQMGGCHISAFAPVATHLIHKGKATTEVKRIVRLAKKGGVRVVSPDWLYKCEETGIRMDERNFPETYDEKHLTLNMTYTQTPKDLSTRTLTPRPSQSLSPGSSGRAGVRTLSPSASPGWSATAGTYHNSAGNTKPSQSFQGGDTVPSSLNMLSFNNSMEVPLTGVPEMNSQQQDKGTHSDMDTTWRPVPMPALNRETRKRRRAQTAPESGSSDPTKDTVKSNQVWSVISEVATQCTNAMHLYSPLYLWFVSRYCIDVP